MTTSHPSSRSAWLALVLLATCANLVDSPWANGQEAAGRQVVMFAVVATPGSTAMDKKISPVVAARLRKTLPNHGFTLVKVKNVRLVAGETLTLPLGSGFVTKAQLITPLDANGKVQMRFDLSLDGLSQFQSIVTTPADQFNFFDKTMLDDSHLLIGVGARCSGTNA
jgi:hypothetical protein